MSRNLRGGLAAVLAAAAGLGLAVAVGSAGASNQASTTTTLGSATGTPSGNICSAGLDCTYVPFSSAGNPTLQVPLDGTVTSLSVNGNGGHVQLRVLRPAGNGKFTGAGTSPLEPISPGMNTYTVSLPVQAGDVLGVDNSESNLLFDTSSANPVFTAYYNSLSSNPGLPDGSTAAPDTNKTGYRLLLSAVVTGTTPTTTTTNGTTVTTTVSGVTTTVVKTVPAQVKPVIGNPTQSRTVWTRRIGTTFSLGLGVPAKLLFVFRQRVGHRNLTRGTLAANGHPGTNRLRFKGLVAGPKKTLKKGHYTVTITATNSAGVSKPVSLKFTITG